MSTKRIVVIGGGPAGSVSAGFLAKLGHEVILLEKSGYPKNHVGESLLTSFPYIIGLLGSKYLSMIQKRVRFNGTPFEVQEKIGAYVTLDQNELVYTKLGWADRFSRSIQIRRDYLDEFLADVARDLGADVRTFTQVTDVDLGNRKVTWRTRSPEDDTSTGKLDYDYLVDASGFAKVTHASIFGDTEQGTRFFRSMDNMAMTSWWSNCKLMSDPVRRKNITVDLIVDPSEPQPLGWAWFIPVDDVTLSVGVVINREKLQRIRQKRTYAEVHDDLLTKIVRGRDSILGPDAKQVTPLQCLPDRSHCMPKSCDAKAGYFLAGDSCMFLDPFLSTGMHMACWGGLVTAITINSLIRNLISSTEASEFHNRMMFRQFARLQMIVSSVLLRVRHIGCTLENIRQDLYPEAWDDALELVLPHFRINSVATATDYEFSNILSTVYGAWRYFCVTDAAQPQSAKNFSTVSDSARSGASLVFSAAAGPIAGGFTEYFGDLWNLNHVGFFSVDSKLLTVRRMSPWNRLFYHSLKKIAKIGMPLAAYTATLAQKTIPTEGLLYRSRSSGKKSAILKTTVKFGLFFVILLVLFASMSIV